jgi:acetyltransferase-like isoleucine patch superfamily enzyme
MRQKVNMFKKIITNLYYIFLKNWSYKTREKYARLIGVQVGKDCRIIGTNFGSEPYLIHIGNHVTITDGVKFINHDGGLWVLRHEYSKADYFRPIVILDNSFIGANSIILPGVTIGPNCVIGAGAVVTKSIPRDTIAAGVPARVIGSIEKYRRHIDEDFFTFGLSREEKREYLLNYFGRSVDEWLEKTDYLDGSGSTDD